MGMILGALMVLASVLTMALYLTSVVNRYTVTEDGLRIDRLSRSTFCSWHEIKRIAWSPAIHTFFVYGPEGMIFYSSTDYFPKLREFLQIVHQRSNCELSKTLGKILQRQE
jgi:hypothetical protein